MSVFVQLLPRNKHQGFPERYRFNTTPGILLMPPTPTVVEAVIQPEHRPQTPPSLVNDETWRQMLPAVPQPEAEGTATAPGLSGFMLPVGRALMNDQDLLGNTTDQPSPTNPETTADPAYYDTSRPTCSLNLVCYKSGAGGCSVQQMQGTLRSKYSGFTSFQAAMRAKPRRPRLRLPVLSLPLHRLY